MKEDPDLDDRKPVFQKGKGMCYTGRDLNIDIAVLTEVATDGTGGVVRSHSFRSGVPTELAKRGATKEQVMGVGRWTSEAWKSYCKLGRTHRMNMVDTLCQELI